MNKRQYLEGLEKFKLPKTEFIILSGGSLLMHGLREQTRDYDLSFSKKLAKEFGLYDCPIDEKGFYKPFPNCQSSDDFDSIPFDIVDGYQCQTLEAILDFKRKKGRPKDLKDIETIERYLLLHRKEED